ncbi:MAG TPA: tRNA pseudouridine(55) synthase TruB [bacterium]|nr:tRNA pseudouridine(55) synthase TruB [bacterium]
MDGIININKQKGMTSYDVIRFIKRQFNFKEKIGHAGTLDPIAEGVLIILIGNATKLSCKFMKFEKEYICTMELGKKTDTDDIQGKIIEEKEVKVTTKEIIETIKNFEGEYIQTPPVVSAIKHQGKPLYKFYREGIIIKPIPKPVIIRDIDIEEIKLPFIKIKVICTKGTYVRSLCRDIGDKLGCGATQVELKRIRIGPFSIEKTFTLQQLKKIGIENAIITIQKLQQILKNEKEKF